MSVLGVDMLNEGEMGSCEDKCNFDTQSLSQLLTGNRVLGGQGSSTSEGNEGAPVWSEPIEGLLWHKPLKCFMSQHTLLCMGLVCGGLTACVSVYT